VEYYALSDCINPQGETTVTEQQFTTNRYAYTLGFKGMFSNALPLSH
jgi:cyanosortase A-associated protein